MKEINKQLNEQEYLEYIKQWRSENKELIDSGKCKKVFLECLPRWGKEGHGKEGSIKWEESINNLIHFIYNNVEGDIKIINYVKKRHSKLIIKYNNKMLEVYVDNFKKCQLGIILNKVTSNFKIEIGIRFKDNKRDIIITDRKYVNNLHNKGKFLKYYKYYCNNCGWDDGKILESSLLSGVGCSVCGYNSKVVVENINSIYHTDKWMIPYIGEECAKTHTHSSNEKVQVVCPDCGRIKQNKIKINDIYVRRCISCLCSDKISYPEKLMFLVLEQLNVVFQTQLSKTTFEWCDNYRYDFYFEYNNEKYVCEVNGKQHYEDAWNKLVKTQMNDKLKKELALKNNIKVENYIVIDCRYSTLEWIRDNDNGILNSRLAEIFDLNKIDWFKAEEYALKNLVKVASEYKKNNPKMTTTEIGQLMGYGKNSIISWLKKGKKLNWCDYDAEKEKARVSSNSGKKSSKHITIFLNKSFKGVFYSSRELERCSEELFGTKLDYRNISAVATGKRKQYKGFKFKYIKDLTLEEYIKYDIENKLKELELLN